MGKGIEKIRAGSETQVGDIELAPGQLLKPIIIFGHRRVAHTGNNFWNHR